MSKSADSSTRIRQLKHAVRQTFIGGRATLTAGVNALPDADNAALLDKVRTFQRFNWDNDPYGEHDFVDIEHDGEKYFANAWRTVQGAITHSIRSNSSRGARLGEGGLCCLIARPITCGIFSDRDISLLRPGVATGDARRAFTQLLKLEDLGRHKDPRAA